MIGHPLSSRLIGYVDGGLSKRQVDRVRAHLAGCVECRQYVQSIQAISRDAPNLLTDEVPEGAIERILERAAQGELVLLNTAEPKSHQRRSFGSFASIAAAVLSLVVVGGVIGTGLASADSSAIVFDPATPSGGDTVTVTYRSASLLAGKDKLHLRARYRTPSDKPHNRGTEQRLVGELTPRLFGSYSGQIVLPDSFAYGVFAVETTQGDTVDSNGRVYWELLAHDGERVSYSSLIQKQNDLIGRNWNASYETAKQTVAEYPGSADATTRLCVLEQAILGSLPEDSVREAQAQRFNELDQQLRDASDLPGAELGAMYQLAICVGADSSSQLYWRQRLLNEAPRHELAIQERAAAVWRNRNGVSAQDIQSYDRLWREAETAPPFLTRMGFGAALQSGDSALIAEWADRNEMVEPWSRTANSARLSLERGLRDLAITRLRDELGALDASSATIRPLHVSRSKWNSDEAALRRELLALLGRALILEGQTDQGLDELRLASDFGWDATTFRAVGDAILSLGDTVGAHEMYGRVVADPATDAEVANSMHSMGAVALGASEWMAAVERARDTMAVRTLSEAVYRHMNLDIILADSSGNEVNLRNHIGDRFTLVAFWSWRCGPSLEQLPKLNDISGRLRAMGVAVAAITPEPRSQQLTAFLEQNNFHMPVFYDIRGEAIRAFNSWGTPQYYIVDNFGRLAFQHVPIEETERYLGALMHAQRSTVVQ